MNNHFPLKTLAAACCLALTGAAQAQSVTTGITTAGGGGSGAVYLKRSDTRFGGFTGSTVNTDSLARGLRTGSEVRLSGSGETVVFTPPTRPMGNGNVTRAMDLAQRDLAASGISNPTPSEIRTAMMGGTITRTDGTTTTTTTFDGVLKLRSEGMGWGQIAHTIGVHPGMGKSTPVAAPAPVPTPHSTVPGRSVASSANSGIVNAGGGASSGAGAITSAGAKGHGNAYGRAK